MDVIFFTVNNELQMKYISTFVPKINIKLNKIMLNQEKHNDMLNEIYSILRKSQNMNDSIIENIILTGFPIDNLASLNEVEKKLKNDNVFYKQLVSFYNNNTLTTFSQRQYPRELVFSVMHNL